MGFDIRPSQEIIERNYRFARTLGEVNWSAQARLDPYYIEREIIPALIKWTGETILQVAYGEENALVGLSGGIDSSTSAFLVAEALEYLRKRRRMKKPQSLVLASFTGNNEEDDKYIDDISQDIIRRYPALRISSVKHDIRAILDNVHKSIGSLVLKSGREQVYAGELPTRVINQHLIELADRIGHALVGSTNGTEVVLGEFVLGCQEELSPLGFIYKSYIYEIARSLKFPVAVIKRPPVNSTWGNDKVCSYFAELPEGFTPEDAYRVLDPVLYGLYDLRFSPLTLAQDLGHGLSFVKRVHARIEGQNHRRRIPLFTTYDYQIRYPSNFSRVTRQHEREMIYESAKRR